ncbi:MAG TPA: hypothetical protein VJ438_05125 [Candidatus Nanoarchaeia archaeon]|nr:hypothetical protein [Candidatus Nanoarchaeia archaeon]
MAEKGVIYSTGQLDCLSYYSKIFSKIKNFVGDREIATKTYIPESIPPFIVHRGSDDSALRISDLLGIPQSFLKLRYHKKLHEVEKQLTEKQKLIWRYFVPRKLVELHYACNHEGVGKSFDRIFIDIDASKGTSEAAYIKVVKQLLKEIRADKELKKLSSYRIYLLWTGMSMHVYLILNKKLPHSAYDKYFAFHKDSLTTKWANNISEKTKVKVKAGHERRAGAVILDTSATPSGKLARCPYSLHLNHKGKLTGVAVPLKESQIKSGLFKLRNLTPDEALRY